MKYFAERRRFNVKVQSFTGKVIKVQQKKETARKRAVVLVCDVPITKEMLENMPPKIRTFLGAGPGDNEGTSFNSMDINFTLPVNCRIFTYNNFAPSGVARISKGFDTDDQVMAAVKKVFYVEDEPFLKLTLILMLDAELWAWGSEIFGGGECTIELQPHQGEIDFEKTEATNPGYVAPAGMPKLSPEDQETLNEINANKQVQLAAKAMVGAIRDRQKRTGQKTGQKKVVPASAGTASE